MDILESRICLECYKEFFPDSEDTDRRNFRKRKYCCQECCDKHNQRPKKGKVTKKCEICGAEFKAYDFVTRTGFYIKYCSPECQHEAIRRRRVEFNRK
jgi:hypothetical protein